MGGGGREGGYVCVRYIERVCVCVGEEGVRVQQGQCGCDQGENEKGECGAVK